jgi:hypothetical protein
MTLARIFTVLTFERHDGQRYCYAHHIAATSSAEAEQLLRTYLQPLVDSAEEVYVGTDLDDPSDDECTSRRFATYTTGSYRGPIEQRAIKDDDHQRWIRAMTQPFMSDGEPVKPALRRVQPTMPDRSSDEAEAPRAGL